MQISEWEPKPRSKLLQAEDTRDQGSVLSITYFLDTQVTSAQNLRFTLHSRVATPSDAEPITLGCGEERWVDEEDGEVSC